MKIPPVEIIKLPTLSLQGVGKKDKPFVFIVVKGSSVMTDEKNNFCEHCEVSLDLHDNSNDCDNATRKARLIESSWKIMKLNRKIQGRDS